MLNLRKVVHNEQTDNAQGNQQSLDLLGDSAAGVRSDMAFKRAVILKILGINQVILRCALVTL
jgi:hypothetical protein